jgi:Domain of unknown function (DUF5069)
MNTETTITSGAAQLAAPDLTQRPPRSPRQRLGGYALLPRMLDKGRATLAGTNGEYHYACPNDQRFLEFAGVDPEALKAELATGKGEPRNPRVDRGEPMEPAHARGDCRVVSRDGHARAGRRRIAGVLPRTAGRRRAEPH